MDLEIEYLLFKQVEKPKNFLMVRSLLLFENRYRVNIYTQTDEEEGLLKKRISSSYFCHYHSGKLTIISEPDKRLMN